MKVVFPQTFLNTIVGGLYGDFVSIKVSLCHGVTRKVGNILLNIYVTVDLMMKFYMLCFVNVLF